MLADRRWSVIDDAQCAGESVLVVVFFLVVIEGDPVLLRKCGVLVFFGTRFPSAIAESEVECPGTCLLQFPCFFEATVTTLLHDRAPESEN